MERRRYANKQCSGRECLEISGIPASVAYKDLKWKVLEILEEIEVPIDPNLAEDCHHLPSKGFPKKVILKLSCHKDIHRILLNKNKLKNLKRESVNLPAETNVFINESLCLSYKKLLSKCKKLWGSGDISAFWLSKELLRNQTVQWICVHSHPRLCFEKNFPGNPLMEDN